MGTSGLPGHMVFRRKDESEAIALHLPLSREWLSASLR